MAAMSPDNWLEFRSKVFGDPGLCDHYNRRCNGMYEEFFKAHIDNLPRDDNGNVIPPNDEYWEQKIAGYIGIDITYGDLALLEYLSRRDKSEEHERVCSLFGRATFDYNWEGRQRGSRLCPTRCPA